MAEQVYHYQVGQGYRIVIERAASTKGVDGFKVEAQGDDPKEVKKEIASLYDYAKRLTSPVLETISG